MQHGPYRATTVGASVVNGLTLARSVSNHYTYTLLYLLHYVCVLLHSDPIDSHNGDSLSERVQARMEEVYGEAAATAREFNVRGDLNAGTNIASFLKVANVMLTHGSV